MNAILILALLLLPSGEEHLIREVLDKQAACWNNGDIPGYMEGYWRSDSLVFTSGGSVSRGWRATLEKYSAKYDSRQAMGYLRFSDVEVVFLSESSAWVLGNWELVREADHPRGVFTLVLRKFRAGWKIVHDHTSVAP
jgi:ketosteroid isomerase-like protein